MSSQKQSPEAIAICDKSPRNTAPEGLLLREVCLRLIPEDIQSVADPKLIIAPDLEEIEL
jgi:hypothetical protein